MSFHLGERSIFIGHSEGLRTKERRFDSGPALSGRRLIGLHHPGGYHVYILGPHRSILTQLQHPPCSASDLFSLGESHEAMTCPSAPFLLLPLAIP